MTLHVDELEPNTWNPNRLTDKQVDHLKREILKREKLSPGGLQPIIAMMVSGHDKKTILDGEHRWQQRKILYEAGHIGFENITTIVVDEKALTESEAKILTLNMNKIRGAPQIREELDYDDIEVDSMKMIVEAPDYEDIPVEEEVDYISLTFQIPAEEMDFVRQTISDVRQSENEISSRGDALIYIMKNYNERGENG
jgi:hypothetical protein